MAAKPIALGRFVTLPSFVPTYTTPSAALTARSPGFISPGASPGSTLR